MALLDLSAVTSALTDFLARAIEVSPAWQPRARPTVTPLPPDQLQVAGLSLYLYHAAESAHLRNQAPPDPASEHVRFTPMALELYYQLSATPAGTTASEHLESQLLFGCALKSMHDTPVLDDTTRIDGTAILQAAGLDGAGNRLRLVLQPVTPSDAVTYWTAGSSPMRLAAYYQASVVLLEPDPVSARAGRVLDYGITTFVTGAPRIARTSTVVSFQPPGAAAQAVEVSPASVAYGSELVVHGSDLSGERVDVVIRGGDGNVRRVVDPDWGIVAQPTELRVSVRDSIDSVPLVPGVYTVAVRTRRTVRGRILEHTSNESPIQIAPVVSALAPVAGGRFRVDGALFSGPGIDDEDVEVFLGAQRLARAGGTPGPGEFEVVDASRIDLAPAAGASSGAVLAVRILVNGAASPPRWITVP